MVSQCDGADHVDDTLEIVRQVVLLSGELTHEIGAALSAPGLEGVSANTDISLLTTLYLADPQRPRELVEPTGLTRGGLSNLFDRLEGHELITRSYGRVDGDRRSALVSLTPQGRALVDAISDAVRTVLVEQAPLLQRICDLIDSVVEPPDPDVSAASSPLDHVERLGRLGIDFATSMADDSDPSEPTPGKATLVLCAAATPEGIRPRDLLELIDLSSGGVTMLLDRLELAGLIDRTSGKAPDRRAMTVTLTEFGRDNLRARLDRAVHHLPQIRSAMASGVPTLEHRSRSV